MAVGISQAEWNKYKFPNYARIHVLIKLFSVRIQIRRALLRLERNRELVRLPIDFTLTSNFDSNATHFQKHGWAFVEDVLPEKVHNQLVQGWPRFYHFNPVKNIYKSYDTNFINKNKTIDQFPIIKIIENYFQSDIFVSRLENYSVDGIVGQRVVSVVFSRASYQSSCINHLDSISESTDSQGAGINFIFFVKGSGGLRSGGTCIFQDADGEVIFEPTNITNTCLIYRSDKIYHGFPPIRFGAFRWMFACHAQIQ